MSLTKPHEYILKSLHEQTRAAPPAGSWRVYVGDCACGWASPAAIAALNAHPGLEHATGNLRLTQNDPALAEVAETLRDSGVLRGWRNELLDIFNDAGSVLARIERAAMRPLGLATRAVHLNAFTPDGNIWIAQRALHKSTDPGMWDTLVGGLIASGETPALALLRESYEEAGLAPTDLAQGKVIGEFVVSRQVPEGYQVEAVTVTDCVLPAHCQPANQDGEVSLIRTASPAEVLEMIEAGLFTTEAALSVLLSMQ